MTTPFPYGYWKNGLSPINSPSDFYCAPRSSPPGTVILTWENQVSGYKLYIDRYDSSHGDWVSVVNGTELVSTGAGTFTDNVAVQWEFSPGFLYYRIWFVKGNYSSALVHSNFADTANSDSFDNYSDGTVSGSGSALRLGHGWGKGIKVAPDVMRTIIQDTFDSRPDASYISGYTDSNADFASGARFVPDVGRVIASDTFDSLADASGVTAINDGNPDFGSGAIIKS